MSYDPTTKASWLQKLFEVDSFHFKAHGIAAHGNVSKAPINLRDDNVYSCLNSSYNVFCSLAMDYENMGFHVSLQEKKSSYVDPNNKDATQLALHVQRTFPLYVVLNH